MEGGLRLRYWEAPLKNRNAPEKVWRQGLWQVVGPAPALAQALAGLCKPWQAIRPWQALAGSGMAGSGRVWQALASQALAGSGRLWQALAGSEKPAFGGPVLFLGVTRFFVGFKGIIIFMRLYAS